MTLPRDCSPWPKPFMIPVATTLKAKGVFPEDHPLSLGVFGYAGTRHSSTAILSDDLELLLVLGSGLNETRHHALECQACFPARTLSGECGARGNQRRLRRRSRGRRGCFRLSRANNVRTQRAPWSPRRGKAMSAGSGLDGIRKLPRLYDAENCSSDAIPIHPARIVAELRRVMPRETVALVDSGAHRAFAGQYWESYEPRTYISATNLGPMGWAIPAGVGVKMARPDRPCVVITGDGCMLMHGLEIQTAARFNVPVIYVVINNAAFGNVWLRASKMGPKPSELTSLPDHDWATVARGLGVKSLTVREPQELAPAFQQALGITIRFSHRCKG